MTDSRKVLVTGASSGIGKASALFFAREGHSLWLTYSTNRAQAEEVAAECRASGAPDVHVSGLDLGSPDAITTLAAEVTSAWGDLHVLVNNGGVSPYTSPDDITLTEWDQVMNVNARSVFLMTQAFLPLLRAAGTNAAGVDRSIVNVSSAAGSYGSATTGLHYSASKGAVLSITRSYALMLAPERIRVNAITPGPIFSVMSDKLTGPARTKMEATIPLGSFGKPEDAAWIIGSLASPGAAFVTGATYDVNGGTRIS